VVVKTVKRRKLEIGAEANGAGAQQDTFMSGAPDGDTKGPKAPKVFLVMPQRPSAPQEDGASEPSQPLIADERVAAEPSDVASTSRTSSPTVPRRKRRRDPLTEPVLVRHVVFEKPEAEVAPQPRQQLEASSTDRVDYKTACHALQELATKLDAMARAQQLLAELDLMCSRHPSRAKIES
jgi:hypothetical protein